MDRWLKELVIRGDVLRLREKLEEDKTIIWKTVPGTLNNILHLAARFGHLEFAEEIVKWCPDIVLMENAELETPLFEACREGHLDMAKLFLEADPWIAFKLNSREESVLFAACEEGNIHVVRHLLKFPQLLIMEIDMETTSLHKAAASGDTEIVKEILKVRPEFAWKKNSHLCTPLHAACLKGHLETARAFMELDSELCLEQDEEGLTPLHCAVIRGEMGIIDEILSLKLESVQMTTNNGETILHLAVKYNHFDVVKDLTRTPTPNIYELKNAQDCDGNTVLHLATKRGQVDMVRYLLDIGVEVNAVHRHGYTALDMAEDAKGSFVDLATVSMLKKAGGKRRGQVSPSAMDVQQVLGSPIKNLHDNYNLDYRTTQHRQRRQTHPRKKSDLHNEGLLNARNTIIIVAVLIATVAFTAGINPPGGFNQETGKAIRGNHADFKVFLVCNIVALFLSLGVVNVLVSIIPFERKNMMKLLTVTHKMMWVSSLFMAAAFIAAIWTIMPNRRGGQWILVVLTSFGGGSTVVVFLGLGFLLARHWHNKKKWRKLKLKKIKDERIRSSNRIVEESKTQKNGEDNSPRIRSHDKSDKESERKLPKFGEWDYASTINSDMESSGYGYYLY